MQIGVEMQENIKLLKEQVAELTEQRDRQKSSLIDHMEARKKLNIKIDATLHNFASIHFKETSQSLRNNHAAELAEKTRKNVAELADKDRKNNAEVGRVKRRAIAEVKAAEARLLDARQQKNYRNFRNLSKLLLVGFTIHLLGFFYCFFLLELVSAPLE